MAITSCPRPITIWAKSSSRSRFSFAIRNARVPRVAFDYDGAQQARGKKKSLIQQPRRGSSRQGFMSSSSAPTARGELDSPGGSGVGRNAVTLNRKAFHRVPLLIVHATSASVWSRRSISTYADNSASWPLCHASRTPPLSASVSLADATRSWTGALMLSTSLRSRKSSLTPARIAARRCSRS
jgi:hypothetical protein